MPAMSLHLRVRILVTLALLAAILAPLASARPAAAQSTTTWRSLVMVYRYTDVTYTWNGTQHRLRSSMTSTDVQQAVSTAQRLPSTVASWSNGYARMTQTFVYPTRPIRSVTSLGSAGFWVSPSNIAADLDAYAPAGRYDSIIVIWRHDDDKGRSIPSLGWGWSIRPTDWSNGAGYSVINTPDRHGGWPGAYPEEIMVHEWGHQVTGFYAQLGFPMPNLDAPTSYGYQRDSSWSWKPWLTDVLTGRVEAAGGLQGVSEAAWATGAPTGSGVTVSSATTSILSTGSLSPSVATTYVGRKQTYTTTYSDTAGWRHTSWLYLTLRNPNGGPQVRLLYNQNQNRMYVRSYDNTRWLGGYTPGTPVTLSLRHVSVSFGASTVSGSGNTLTVRWNLSFNSWLSGRTYNAYLLAYSDAGTRTTSNWVGRRYVR